MLNINMNHCARLYSNTFYMLYQCLSPYWHSFHCITFASIKTFRSFCLRQQSKSAFLQKFEQFNRISCFHILKYPRIPFLEEDALIGQYILLFIDGIGTLYAVNIHTATFTFHSSCSIFLNAFVGDIRTIFNDMDSIEQTSQIRANKLKLELLKVIDIHVKMIGWVHLWHYNVKYLLFILIWFHSYFYLFEKYYSKNGVDNDDTFSARNDISCIYNCNKFIFGWNGSIFEIYSEIH